MELRKISQKVEQQITVEDLKRVAELVEVSAKLKSELDDAISTGGYELNANIRRAIHNVAALENHWLRSSIIEESVRSLISYLGHP